MKKIQFKNDSEKITITIPSGLLIWAAEHNPEIPMKVLDKNKFVKQVMFELKNNLGAAETGLTGFQELLDEAILEVAGDECVELIEDAQS